jgi:murein DD-endopeptidase MepM/ murein hydrolase activator NlpD
MLLLGACSGGSTAAAPVGGGSGGAVVPSVTPSPPTSSAPAPSPAASTSKAKPTPKPSPKPSPKPTRSPTQPPVVSGGHYAFPVRCASAISYGHSHHDYPATDIFAAKGCLVVAPVSGYIDEVSLVDTWSSSTNLGATRGGLSFSIVGTDGVRYYGSHLSAIQPGIRPGVRVVVGQLIGKVGNSGDARGIASHLHFGISWPTPHGLWWIRRGEVYPWPYLDSWRAGGSKSPAAAVAARKAQVGNGPCTVDC